MRQGEAWDSYAALLEEEARAIGYDDAARAALRACAAHARTVADACDIDDDEEALYRADAATWPKPSRGASSDTTPQAPATVPHVPPTDPAPAPPHMCRNARPGGPCTVCGQ